MPVETLIRTHQVDLGALLCKDLYFMDIVDKSYPGDG